MVNPPSTATRQNDSQEEFDYIICGGGTSGCVIASRLSEDPNVSVLVIEAGKNNELLEDAKMPGGWGLLFNNSNDGWSVLTEPLESLQGRQVRIHRSRFVGGCSGVNGTLCVRGLKQDYDDWGLPGWNGKEFWPNMNKAEKFHPKEWFPADEANHGSAGYLHTEPHDPAPITELLLESMVSQGMPYTPDMFVTGDTAVGCGHATRTVYDGNRSTAADFITIASERLTLWTEMSVDKINLEQVAGEWQATSVDVVNKEGHRVTARARKEIIVSGGAYGSPAILLRSGIGSKSKVESVGIESKVELSGVGENLMDHLIVLMFYEVSRPGLTTDHEIYPLQDGFPKAYQRWKESRTGFLSTIPFGALAFSRLDARLEDSALWRDAHCEPGRDPLGLTPAQPHIEFFNTECYAGPLDYIKYPDPGAGQSAFAMVASLQGAKSRGSLTLKNKDPRENPVVDHNYLDDPLDMLVLSEACKLGNEVVMKGAGTREVVKGSWPPDSRHHAFTTRDEWVPFVREHATTCFHPSGTCKMGKKDDPMAVLDERLRVLGVNRLRVADASVVPLLPSGHPQMITYGIGEKCADMIKEDNREP